MTRGQLTWMAVAGAAIAVAAGEDVARRSVKRQYAQAIEGRRQLEVQFGELAAAHDTLKNSLTEEQQRSQELSAALNRSHGQLEEATGRLNEESRNVKDLQVRLATIQRQMDQLQGELSETLKSRDGSAAADGGPVKLERIIVSNDASPKGRVLSVNPSWNFVIVDLGWSTVRIGDTVSIVRNDQVLAKAKVERVQEGVCAATILPDWAIAEIRVNDAVQVL